MAGVLILSIETSTGCGSVALTSGTSTTGRLIAEITHRPDVTHSRRLLGSIRQLLAMAEVDWKDLDGVAVSMGPGSFTGLRIGMAAAKGIAMAADLPLLGVVSLDGLSLHCLGVERPVCCILDARKGQVYGALYQYNPEQQYMERQGPVESFTPQALVRRITQPTCLAGPGCRPYLEYFQSQKLLDILPDPLIQPRAGFVGFLGAKQLVRGDISPPEQLTPFYVRASEAEINADRPKHTGR